MGYVLVPTWVTSAIREERSRRVPNETGGFLIGIRRGPHIEVTSFTSQGPRDRATGTTFERSCLSHRTQIHRTWNRSDGIESLVGDWHSHPHGSAAASDIDRSAWKAMVRASGRPIVGLIDAGASLPRIYLAAKHRRDFDIELVLAEREVEHLVFAVPGFGKETRLVRRDGWLM